MNKTPYDLRYPTFVTQRAAKNAEIPELTSAEVVVPAEERGLAGSPTKVRKTYTPTHEKNGMRIDDLGGAEAAKKLVGLMTAAKLL
jgi:electron transfer flavoprotein beta subunit